MIVVFVLTLCEVFFETAYNWPIYITIGFVLLELLSLLPIVIAQSVRNAKLYVPFIIIQVTSSQYCARFKRWFYNIIFVHYIRRQQFARLE